MDAQRWAVIESLYHAALAKEVGERSAFLAAACAEDPTLRREVESLLGYADAPFSNPVEPSIMAELLGKICGIAPSDGAEPVGAVEVGSTPALSPGMNLGPYRVLSYVGSGGMGVVYRAQDTRLGRTVALKVMLPGLASSPESIRRFDQEARAISSLNHPHICSLFDVGHENGTNYIVMEYLRGVTLAQRLRASPMPFREVLTYAIQIASALREAHKYGIVHRDLKPGNIMVTQWGAKLMDFGLAKNFKAQSDSHISHAEHLRFSTQKLWQRKFNRLLKWRSNATTDMTISTVTKTDCGGTLPYMAPEQINGNATDWRSDVFSFGAVLYEMATGHQAFGGRDRNELIAAILFDNPPPVSRYQNLATKDFDRFVQSCLSKNPVNRCQGPDSLLAELTFVASSVQKKALAALARELGGSFAREFDGDQDARKQTRQIGLLGFVATLFHQIDLLGFVEFVFIFAIRLFSGLVVLLSLSTIFYLYYSHTYRNLYYSATYRHQYPPVDWSGPAMDGAALYIDSVAKLGGVDRLQTLIANGRAVVMSNGDMLRLRATDGGHYLWVWVISGPHKGLMGLFVRSPTPKADWSGPAVDGAVLYIDSAAMNFRGVDRLQTLIANGRAVVMSNGDMLRLQAKADFNRVWVEVISGPHKGLRGIMMIPGAGF